MAFRMAHGARCHRARADGRSPSVSPRCAREIRSSHSKGLALLSKYLRLRRDWQGADLGSGLHRRLAQELAELERAFGDTGATSFADTQPFEQIDQDLEKCIPKAD